MASKQAHKRLTKEYLTLEKSPTPYFIARPLESNILEWHYVLTGPKDTPYEGGEYHGVILFPKEYPFKPPGIKMFTPNGRFKPNFKLCLSMSDYHPDTWNPAWSVSTILTGLLSFMVEETETTGSIRTDLRLKTRYVQESMQWNREQKIFCDVFPELVGKEVPKKEEEPNVKSPVENSVINLDVEQSLNFSRLWYLIPGLFLYLIFVKVVSRM